MSENKSLKSYIEELIQEVENELDETNVTGNVDGYQTPHAFSRKSDNERRKKTATQFGYELVDNDVNNIDEGILQDREKALNNLKIGAFVNGGGYGPFKKINKDTFVSPKGKKYNSSALIKLIGTFGDFKVNEDIEPQTKKIASLTGTRADAVKQFVSAHSLNITKLLKFVEKGKLSDRMDFVTALSGKPGNPIQKKMIKMFSESINENRWLELKNDDSMHANKKLAVGLKELKYQLAEVEKFFSWYNKIKNINELDSDNYWKRTNTHIYKIKERLINIARTLQEIEK